MSKREIDYRMKSINSSYKLTAIEKSRKLKSLQVTENKIQSRINQLQKQKKEIQKDIDECQINLNKISQEKRHIDQHKSPIVTEHAILKYIERYKNIDLNEIHDEIINLPDNDKVKSGMTIVTVFPDKNDHFNLAERETM